MVWHLPLLAIPSAIIHNIMDKNIFPYTIGCIKICRENIFFRLEEAHSSERKLVSLQKSNILLLRNQFTTLKQTGWEIYIYKSLCVFVYSESYVCFMWPFKLKHHPMFLLLKNKHNFSKVFNTTLRSYLLEILFQPKEHIFDCWSI